MARHMKLDDGSTVIRSRVDRATACYYPKSKRVVMIAAARVALDELQREVDRRAGRS